MASNSDAYFGAWALYIISFFLIIIATPHPHWYDTSVLRTTSSNGHESWFGLFRTCYYEATLDGTVVEKSCRAWEESEIPAWLRATRCFAVLTVIFQGWVLVYHYGKEYLVSVGHSAVSNLETGSDNTMYRKLANGLVAMPTIWAFLAVTIFGGNVPDHGHYDGFFYVFLLGFITSLWNGLAHLIEIFFPGKGLRKDN